MDAPFAVRDGYPREFTLAGRPRPRAISLA